MDLAFNYRILVAEEFCLINYELKMMLQKNGFQVIEDSGKGMLSTIETKSPDFIITCISALKKIKEETIIQSLLSHNEAVNTTDTIVLDSNMKPIVRYPKPFNSNDIINFILKHINLNLKSNYHENNI
jgi:hypothetical protein